MGQSYAGYMVECTKQVLESLGNAVENGGEKEFEIGEYMTRLTADIISRTEFDSNYQKGKQIFHLLTLLQHLCARASRHLCFPGSRYANDLSSMLWKKKNICLEFDFIASKLQILPQQVQQRNKITENRGGEAINGDHTEPEGLRGDRAKQLVRQRFAGDVAERNAEEEIRRWVQLEFAADYG